jgi:ABC-type uncharacterized transport system ATPase subunit
MTTTTRYNAANDADLDVATAAAQDIDYSQTLNRSTEMLLMNEALARVRMRELSQGDRAGARRPARVIAILARKRRDRW